MVEAALREKKLNFITLKYHWCNRIIIISFKMSQNNFTYSGMSRGEYANMFTPPKLPRIYSSSESYNLGSYARQTRSPRGTNAPQLPEGFKLGLSS